jgi:predicted enzyme related to lactoylglutathione lyase
MLNGLRTVIYGVTDLDAAKAWYSDVLGFGPYFDEPFYVGYNVGGYELGLHPGDTASVTTYWGVDDIEAARAAIIAKGARPHADIQDVGEGIRVASVLDPDGNEVGLIYNPHFVAAG